MEWTYKGEDLLKVIFLWSIDDVLNKNLYKDKVKQIPETFLSTTHYLNSFIFPLIEETRAELCSGLNMLPEKPTSEITCIRFSNNYTPPNELLYDVQIKRMVDGQNSEDAYSPETGDLIALTDVRPKCVQDLCRSGDSYLIALVQHSTERDENVYEIQILASKSITPEHVTSEHNKQTPHFVVFLSNLTTNIRIWKALRSDPGGRGVSIIKQMLRLESSVGRNCDLCFFKEKRTIDVSTLGARIRSFNLNESQEDAVLGCLAIRECNHESTVKLIWGPPGTGKTKTVSSLLFALLKRKCKTLTCTPTNIAVLEVANQFLRIVRESLEQDTYGLGDIVLFGNQKRMNINARADLLDVFLDHRADILAKCFAPSSGWSCHVGLIISLLEYPEKEYQEYLELQESNKRNNTRYISKYEKLGHCNFVENGKVTKPSLLKFVKQVFYSILKELRTFVMNMCSHLPTSSVPSRAIKKMNDCLELLKYFGTLLPDDSVTDERFKGAITASANIGARVAGCALCKLGTSRKDCVEKLNALSHVLDLPDLCSKHEIKRFCLGRARMLFCTASSSYRLHKEDIDGVEMVLIDEAAQLKECESVIPLLLPSLRHVVLVGDERQLPALVKSEISQRAGFGRSLFRRRVLLGHQKHLLNIQYRMHPVISLFPNGEFYDNQILDSSSVVENGYHKQFLNGTMFSSFSFINVPYGQEVSDQGKSLKNMVEVAVVSEIVVNLFKESVANQRRVSVGVISPYKAQVSAIQENLGKIFSSDFYDNFSLVVRTVDGFQGGEEDVIIISTVRCNAVGLVGFLSDPHRTNVTLTRARHCLWIIGHEATLVSSGSVWERLVVNAKTRGYFHNACEDERLAHAIVTALVELHQVDILLNDDSLLFKRARWKVCFNHEFRSYMSRIKSIEVQKKICLLVMRLSTGWRHPHNKISFDFLDGFFSELPKLYDVDDMFYLVGTVDILQVESNYIQVLKFWGVVQLSEVSALAKDIAIFYSKYSVDCLNCCIARCSDGNLDTPMTWSAKSIDSRRQSIDPVQFICDQLSRISLNDL